MEKYRWQLVLNPKGTECAVFYGHVTAAKDYAFEEGKGSVVISVADRGAQPDAGSALLYVAEPREYMIRDAEGRDVLHAPDESKCVRTAQRWGPGTKVYVLGRDLRETGRVLFEVKE